MHKYCLFTGRKKIILITADENDNIISTYPPYKYFKRGKRVAELLHYLIRRNTFIQCRQQRCL